jgi:preprotein translocase subunit SecB
MNDNTNNAGEQQNLPPIMIHTQYIKDMSLEIPHAPEIFRELTTAPKIDVQVEVNAHHLHDNFHNVSLSYTLNGEINGKKLFILELEYSAVVSLMVLEEHIKPVLMVEIPRMLFPFVRSIVANAMIDGGLPPVMLNPIDFAAMLQNREQNDKKQ